MSLSSRLLRLTILALLPVLPSASFAQVNAQFLQPSVTATGGKVTDFVAGTFQYATSGQPDLLYINAFATTGTTHSVTAGVLLNNQGFTGLTENQITFQNVLGAAVATADFDGDNITDYAFALSPITPGGTNLCVYYGTDLGLVPPGVFSGGGVYPPAGKSGCIAFPIQPSTLPSFTTIVAAPFKTQHLSQLFVEDTRNNYIYVLSNKGTGIGGFAVTQQIAIPTADGAGPIYTGDFNGDGNTDLLVNNQTSHRITLYYGNGDGTFQAPVPVAIAGNVHSMLLHDMHDKNPDGILDLVVELDNGVIQIYLGTGSSTGAPFGSSSVGGTAPGLNGITGDGGHLAAIGDVNNDGILDILTTTPIGLSVLLGQGGFQYQLKGIYNIGPGRSIFTLADFDGNGTLDLAVDSPEGIAIALGNADGSFQTSRAYSAGLPALGATVGQFRNLSNNPKGDLDVAVATTFEQGQLMLGDGTGVFTAASVPTNPALPSSTSALWSNILAGDFDGDGNPDLLYSVTGLPLPTPGPTAGTGLVVTYGNGDGTFTAPYALNPQTAGAPGDNNLYGESAIGDFNGDHIDDIANIDTYYYDTLLSQKTGGAFTLGLNIEEDANNATEVNEPDSFSQVAAGFFTTGRTTMQDLVFQDDANLTPYVNNRDGTGTFTAMPNLSNPPPVSALYGGTILIADIDGDGNGDIIVPYHNLGSDPSNPQPSLANQLYIWYGNGDGTFQAPVITTLSRNYYLAQVVDMNNDGLPDLVLSDGYLVSILYNLGNRTFGNEQHFLAGQGINSISVADVNHDGSLDLVLANGGSTISDAVAIGGKTQPSIALTPNPDVNTGGITVLLNQILTKPVTGILTVEGSGQYQKGFVLNAIVSASTGTVSPTGTISFSINGTVIGSSAVTNTSGSVPGAIATFSIPDGNTYTGTLTLSATYSGDTLYSPLTFYNTYAITGSGSTTSLDLCISPAPGCPQNVPVVPPFAASLIAYYGQGFNGSASAASTDSSTLDPTSTITFDDAYNGAPPVTLCILGITYGSECPPAVGETIGTAVGTHIFTAVYSGDATHTGSTSPPVTITYLQDTNAATLAGAPNPSPQGQPVTFTAIFTGNYAAPTGTVIFSELFPPTTAEVLLGTATLVPGSGLTSTATFITSALPVGTDTIQVSYASTPQFASASAITTETITPVIATSTHLASSLNPSLDGQSVTFTAAVATATGTPIPTGTVTFSDGTTTLGTGTLVNGVATFTTSTLTAGTHAITATASGDIATAPSTSAPLQQVVNPLPPPGSVNFKITVTPSPVTVSVGNATQLLVTVTPLNGFTQSVTLSCGNLPNESVCTFPNPLIPAGGASTNLLLTTMAPHNCGSTQPYFIGGNGPTPRHLPAAPLAIPALAGLAVLFVPGRRWLRALIAVVAIAGAMQITACGNCTDLGTRPATYTIQITGAASGTSEVESTPVTLNVTI